ncbi:serine hydrolase [Salininema proteolyticum]|uniref:Serine hydrolase n=1 Tax=Salininema proteolyticum TaxID=1607685 RepID=A0ABV8TU14_9ACTN
MNLLKSHRPGFWIFVAAPVVLAVAIAGFIIVVRESPAEGQGAEDRETYTRKTDEELAGSEYMPSEEEQLKTANDQLSAKLEGLVENAGLPEGATVSIAVSDGTYTGGAGAEVEHSGASLTKLEVLAMLVDHYGDPEEIPGWVDGLMAEMITESKNEATDRLLFNVLGGFPDLEEAHGKFGLEGTHEHEIRRWGYTVTTAADQLHLLDVMLSSDSEHFDEAQRDYMLDLLSRVESDQDWGVSAATEGDYWVKNGWDTRPDLDIPWVVHSAGVLDAESGEEPVRMVIMTSGFDSLEDGVAAVESLSPQVRALLTATAGS